MLSQWGYRDICKSTCNLLAKYWLAAGSTLKGGWRATSEVQLKNRIQRALRSIREEVPRTMMERVPERVRRAERRGVNSSLHWSHSVRYECSQPCVKFGDDWTKYTWFMRQVRQFGEKTLVVAFSHLHQHLPLNSANILNKTLIIPLMETSDRPLTATTSGATRISFRGGGGELWERAPKYYGRPRFSWNPTKPGNIFQRMQLQIQLCWAGLQSRSRSESANWIFCDAFFEIFV